MNVYSEDFHQELVAAAIECDMPKSEAAHLFGASLFSVQRCVRIIRQ
jgi:hypothetical protein